MTRPLGEQRRIAARLEGQRRLEDLGQTPGRDTGPLIKNTPLTDWPGAFVFLLFLGDILPNDLP